MKKLIVYVMLMCSSAMAVEYGYFSRISTDDEFNQSVTLEAGDRLVIENISQIGAVSKNASTTHFVQIICNYAQGLDLTRSINVMYKNYLDNTNDEDILEAFPENLRSIVGPCVLSPTSLGANGNIIDYKIIRAAESAAPLDSKYTASLNADGTRLAIGEQQGTNTSTRVYEFNDDNETWEQLGDSVE